MQCKSHLLMENLHHSVQQQKIIPPHVNTTGMGGLIAWYNALVVDHA